MATKKPVTAKPTVNSSGKPQAQFIIPVAFPNAVTSRFNAARNYSFAPNRLQLHEGIDFAPLRDYRGDLPVISAAAGRVVAVRNDPRGYGNYVVVDHQNGFQTLYGHLSNVAVRVNDILTQGQRLGTAGNTGNSSATHLHFNVIDTRRSRGNYVYGGVVDPNDFLFGTARTLTNIIVKPSLLSNNQKPNQKPNNSRARQVTNNSPIPLPAGLNSYVSNPQQTPPSPVIIGGASVPVNTVMFPNTSQPNTQNLAETIPPVVDVVGTGLDDVKKAIEDAAPYILVAIIAVAVAVISAYKFIKD